jgi:precorrin-2 dehydrogenase/sirohydrochlorin ferrochelatase
MANLFPAFLKLEGRRCLVVGGGRTAEQKVNGLLSAAADVLLVSPEATDGIRALAAAGQVHWEARTFTPSDLDGAVLVVAATGDRTVNEEVFRSAEARRILCNAVDEPEHCHFYFPAIVRRGDLQIAISTAGHSPALAQRLRAELESLFGPEYENWLRWLGGVRALMFRRPIDPERRKQALHRIASREVFDRFIRAQKRVNGVSR